MHECTDTWAARRNSGSGHEKAADACSGGRTTACDPHALAGDQCGPDLKHSTTKIFVFTIAPDRFAHHERDEAGPSSVHLLRWMMHGGVHCVEGCTLDDTRTLTVSVFFFKKKMLLLMSGSRRSRACPSQFSNGTLKRFANVFDLMERCQSSCRCRGACGTCQFLCLVFAFVSFDLGSSRVV